MAQLQWSNLSRTGDDDGQSNFELSASQSTVPLTTADGRLDVAAYSDNKAPASPDEQYTWDIVFVFKVGDEKKMLKFVDKNQKQVREVSEAERFRETTADMVNRFRFAGFKTDLWYSVQQDEIYCRIGAPEKRLQREADRIDYEVQLDAKKCLEYASAMQIKLAKATQKGDVVDENAWLNLYGPYNGLDPQNPQRQELYLRYNTEDKSHPRYNSFFTSIDRLKLSVIILESEVTLQGVGISMDKCIASESHAMMTWFPLHEHDKKRKLMDKWMRISSTFNAPLNDIRAYFGEKIAFYFAFLAFYNRMLVLPALLGLGLFIWQRVEDRIDVHGAPPFAGFIAVWATLLLEAWKRKQAKYRVRWGMVHFEDQEQPRPEFKGVWSPSPITGKLEQSFPFLQKLLRLIFSQSVIWTLIGVVLASVVGIFFFRKAIRSIGDGANIITAIVNAIQINILNVIYGLVARRLNDFENHKTDSEYENALIAKTFLFKFVNSYNSLFYIAFFKKDDVDTGGCKDADCLSELFQQLATIFIAQIVINNTLEVGIPLLKSYLTARANRAAVEQPNSEEARQQALYKQKSQPELEFELEQYASTFDDFDEIVIQYGYVTMFVVAFPLAPLAALLNNFLETRIDSQKVCSITRRPEPRGAAHIGTWYAILNVIGFIAVGTNAALIAWETEVILRWISIKSATYCVDPGTFVTPPGSGCLNTAIFPTDGRAERAYAFIVSEHIVILLKFAIDYFVPDEPAELTNHIARNEYIVNVLLKGMEDEEEEVQVVNGEVASDDPEIKDGNMDWNTVSKEIITDEHTFRAPVDQGDRTAETVPPNVT